jgi:hypothetical protein
MLDYNKLLVLAGKSPSVVKHLHPHLLGHGFSHKHDVSHHTTRYVKRGFYDGDFPNAHQSKKTTHTHTFHGNAEHKKSIHKHLKDYGFSHHNRSFKDRKTGTKHTYDTYNKGAHWVQIHHKNNKTDNDKIKVTHIHETSKPDHAFERSGRGHGQII